MDSCSQHILLSDTSIVEVCVAGVQLVAHIRGGLLGRIVLVVVWIVRSGRCCILLKTLRIGGGRILCFCYKRESSVERLQTDTR